jgi:hypothetical protein
MFMVLAGVAALKTTPGRNPVMNRVTWLLWSPGLPVAKMIGNARIWPWPTEKGGFPSAVLLGGLGLFAAGVWTAGGMALWTIGKRIMNIKPNHTSDGICQPADGLPKPSR